MKNNETLAIIGQALIYAGQALIEQDVSDQWRTATAETVSIPGPDAAPEPQVTQTPAPATNVQPFSTAVATPVSSVQPRAVPVIQTDFTLTQVQEVIGGYIKDLDEVHQNQILQLIQSYGVDRVSNLPPEVYSEFLVKAKEIADA